MRNNFMKFQPQGMHMKSTFLSELEIAELTDIRTGRHGKTREQRQIEILDRMKLPYYISAAGRPKVARANIEGVVAPKENKRVWEPKLQ